MIQTSDEFEAIHFWTSYQFAYTLYMSYKKITLASSYLY